MQSPYKKWPQFGTIFVLLDKITHNIRKQTRPDFLKNEDPGNVNGIRSESFVALLFSDSVYSKTESFIFFLKYRVLIIMGTIDLF